MQNTNDILDEEILEQNEDRLPTYESILKENKDKWMGYNLLDTNYVDKWTNLLKERKYNYDEY